MTGDRLREIGRALYEGHGWQVKLAAALHKDTSTLRRWVQRDRVPFLAAKAIEGLYKARKPKWPI
jgi:hypothetical protein